MEKTDLSTFNNDWYKPGGNALKRMMWYFTNILFIKNAWCPSSSLKVFLLRLYGAKIGKGVIIKPSVNIKYPWRLKTGDHVWIGEHVWIDNLANTVIGNNVCLSQGVLLLCGNHDYKESSFDLMIGDIKLEDGVWIGAKSIVTPGVICKSHSILAVNSVATKDLEAYTIYQGNPAREVRKREMNKKDEINT